MQVTFAAVYVDVDVDVDVGGEVVGVDGLGSKGAPVDGSEMPLAGGSTAAPSPSSEPSLEPEPLVACKIGTATKPAGQTAGMQLAVVDANTVCAGDVDEDAVPPTVGVSSPSPPDDPLPDEPVSTAGASPIPLAPSSPAEGGVTLL